MPKVSILIPLYNSEKYIADTIQSALNQTYPNIEVIIVDDGSRDNSFSIAKQFESKQVTVLSQKNKGASTARNKAFENCTGELIQYLDADDLLHPDKIKLQVEEYYKHQNPDILLSGTWGRFTLDENQVQWEKQTLNKNYSQPIEWLIDAWNGLGMAQPGTWLTPRKLIEKAGPWNETLSLNDDGEFFSRVILSAEKIIHIAESKVYYRSQLSDSLSQCRSKKAIKSELNSYKLYAKHCLIHTQSIALRKALASNFLNFSYQYHSSFNELVLEAKNEFQSLNIGKMWPVGPRRFKCIAYIIGFENTLKLKQLLRI